jgi:lipopolysaccharide transport system permease protein
MWALLKPTIMTLVFMIMRNFIGINTGEIPYPILTFAALLPWIFFQEATSEGISSVINNSMLIRKIYFPREILPVTSLLTKIMELIVNFFILALLMLYYRMVPTINILWVPAIMIYTMTAVLVVSLAGSAINVYYRDVGAAIPVLLSLLMYASPVIYPLSLVEKALLVNKTAGEWSGFLFTLYTMNPMVGIIDSFQKSLLYGLPPDLSMAWPGALFTLLLLPASYRIFRRAESYFADVV